jgi:Domain of unknown function (DUF5664)/Nucleoside 2-deoxyribosyltransferase
MKIYIAARYSRKMDARVLSETLRLYGYGITSTWIEEPESPNVQLSEVSSATLTNYAERDIEEINAADVFLLLSDPSTEAHPRGGKHVEFGYAYAKGKRCIVYGPTENIFHMLPDITVVSTRTALLDELRREQVKRSADELRLRVLDVTKPPAPQDSGEVIITDPKTGGQKGSKKCRMDLIPPKTLWDLGLVYGMGATKYTPYNWMRGYAWSLSIAALLRHLTKFVMGEYLDKESGLPHLSHVQWHCATLMEFTRLNLGTDDRQITLTSTEGKTP